MLGAVLAVALVVAAPALASHLTGLRIENGTNGDDVLIGTDRRDGLFGKDGDDVLRGLGAADFLDADSNDANTVNGSGTDIVSGGAGADSIYGGPDSDALSGGRGDDFINDGRYRNNGAPTTGDSARDTIDCGPGRDTVRAQRIDAVSSDCERVTRRP
jgi:Ca2+-binding RTX toxin-like protein